MKTVVRASSPVKMELATPDLAAAIGGYEAKRQGHFTQGRCKSVEECQYGI